MVPDTSVFQNVIGTSNILPDPDTFVKQSYDMAWPQILAFTTAIVGIMTVVLILKSISKS